MLRGGAELFIKVTHAHGGDSSSLQGQVSSHFQTHPQEANGADVSCSSTQGRVCSVNTSWGHSRPCMGSLWATCFHRF